ncbi:hypothetical protein chiPu_0021406 [Chiloscyllium punctatum]|uniref:Uncharacterized protein n=1 Tax=Chiloscyllium punctatum TaxID=137246 RepID=A0A401REL8_CHIPU|nr:hypothetical protein [Chiloscyllium punctatum]
MATAASRRGRSGGGGDDETTHNMWAGPRDRRRDVSDAGAAGDVPPCGRSGVVFFDYGVGVGGRCDVAEPIGRRRDVSGG